MAYVSAGTYEKVFMEGTDFSSSVVKYSIGMIHSMLFAMQFCIAFKSKSLVRAYQILSEKVTCEVTSRVTFVDCCVMTITCIYVPYITVFFSSLPIHRIEVILVSAYAWAIYFILTAYSLTFRYLYSTISQKLFDEVEQAIISSTDQLITESDTKMMNGNITMTTPALNQLEREICTVSHSVLKS